MISKFARSTDLVDYHLHQSESWQLSMLGCLALEDSRSTPELAQKFKQLYKLPKITSAGEVNTFLLNKLEKTDLNLLANMPSFKSIMIGEQEFKHVEKCQYSGVVCQN